MDSTEPVIDRKWLDSYMVNLFPAREICDFFSAVAPLKFREFAFSVPRLQRKSFNQPRTSAVATAAAAATTETSTGATTSVPVSVACTSAEKGDVEGVEAEDYVVRSVSFRDSEELSAFVKKRHPSRIDVGATWTCEPSLAKSGEVEEGCHRLCAREIVFDIDIDAYNDSARGPVARKCCTGASWCHKCWPILTTGCCVAAQRLRDCGAPDSAWFYSGRRGMHCWVKSGWLSWFSNSERQAFFSMVSPQHRDVVEAALSKHPDPSAVSTVMRVSGVHTGEVSRQQLEDLLGRGCGRGGGGEFLNWYAREHAECAFGALSEAARILGVDMGDQTLCRVRRISSEFSSQCGPSSSSVEETISALAREVESFDRDGSGWTVGTPCNVVAGAIALAGVQCLMPRFDSNVTPDQQHLLRCPFTVNPTTGRVAMFVEENDIRSFYPSRDCPSIIGLGEDEGGVVFENSEAFENSLISFKKWVSKKQKY